MHFFFESHRDVTMAFLLGCLLASVKSVLKSYTGLNTVRIIFLLIGLALGYYMVGEPFNLFAKHDDVEWYILIIGGALSSAAMIIPGIPGSSVLIIMGIYDSILSYIKEFQLIKLSIYGLGAVGGAVLLLNLLESIYDKYREQLSHCFAGLILGSARALLPYNFGTPVLFAWIIGFTAVWIWSGKEQ